MNALTVLTVLSAIQFCCSNFTKANADGVKADQNKTHREVEPFTSILLDNESFSIVSVPKHPFHKSKGSLSRRKENFNRIMNIDQPMKGKYERQNIYKSHKAKPYKAMPYNVITNKSYHVRGSSARKGVAHDTKRLPTKNQGHVIKHPKNSTYLKKNIHKRHFENPISHYSDTNREFKRNKVSYDFGPTYRYVLTEAINTSRSIFSNNQPKPFDEQSALNNNNDFFENLNANPWNNAERLPTRDGSIDFQRHVTLTSNRASTWSSLSSLNQDSLQVFTPKSGDYQNKLYENVPLDTNRNYKQPPAINTVTWLSTTAPPMHSTGFHQADIIQRNLEAASQKKKTGKGDTGDDSGFGDTVITFNGGCGQIQNQNQTCCVQREVGDVQTLALKINSSKKPSSFQVRWMKLYHKYDSSEGKPLELEPEKLPWNMVSGSEGRELRLNPVTNSDIDPNCFIAQVFMIKKKNGKVLYTKLKKMIFRIEIPIIDMGKLYAGEEVNINMENFVSLPERGNLLLQWNLETKPQVYEYLPSNIKVSPSGRSVLLKELKKGQLGILNCVVYSSNRYAVAKRRFNILKIVENVKRRSTMPSLDPVSRDDLDRKRRCHLLMEKEARKKLRNANKPKSRKKRFRRMESARNQLSETDCESLKNKGVNSRLIRSVFGELTTEDSRLMPLEKLFELSEEGDGTLDDMMPREIHYVSPKVRLISGTATEISADHPISTNCTADSDCIENAHCVFTEEKNSTERIGSCYCRPEFYRDGQMCRKIPLSTHREKRLKRNARNDFAVAKHLFYQNSREIAKSTPETLEEDEDESTELPKILAFEEEESFLLTDCIDDRDCSMHSNCVQPTNGHPYCKCRPGFRGNGIFCWEMMDYVPAEEQFLTDEEINPFDESLEPENSMDRMAFKTAEPPEVENN